MSKGMHAIEHARHKMPDNAINGMAYRIQQ